MTISAQRDQNTITFGCVPAVDDVETRARLLELCMALSAELSVRVVSHRAESPSALAESFGNGDVNLAWVSPTLALTAQELRDGIPVVSSKRQGMVHYHGVLFVKADSPIQSPMDLVGTRAAWVDPSSASGYLFPRMTLAVRGLDITTLFVKESFHNSHGAVAQAVLRGEADVGATFAAFEHGDPTRPLVRAGFMDVAEPEDAKILLATTAIPADVMIASRALHERWKMQLLLALTQLNSNAGAARAMRHVLGAEGFVACDLEALNELRQQIIDVEALEQQEDT